MNQTLEKPAAPQTAGVSEAAKFHISTSPHLRSSLTTGEVMYDVILSLLPVTVAGIWNHGFHAFLVVAMSIVSAMFSEFVFDYITGRPNTLKDGSAIVTGLLLALTLPASVPLYIPYAGSLVAVVIVKGLFGGLGKNFMNPALIGRCFLLISFGATMTNYTLDGVSGATPLATLADGGVVNISQMFLGTSNGVIGSSILAMMVGGFYLWIVGGITFEIPVAAIVSFTLFMAMFGGQGFDPLFLLAHLSGGGIVMGAIFMATDPVTSPVTSTGQLIYGVVVGVLSGIFRVFGNSADSVSYAILFSNLVVPIIDEFIIPKPYGYRSGAQEGYQETEGASKNALPIPMPALTLCVITLLAGVCLSVVYRVTKDPIEQQKMAANVASYQEVCPGASSFSYDDDLNAAVEALGGEAYGTDFGKSYINEIVVGDDGSYVLSVTSGDAYDGTLTIAVGISADGTVQGISFTELHDSAGMGMLCGEDAFKSQFSNVQTDAFILNKAGGASADNEINSVSGASVSSGAVVNAVNAAIDFWKTNAKGGA